MMKAELLSWANNSSIGNVELPSAIFDVEVKPHLVSEVIRWQRAKARSGTHMVKTKGLVSGGGKKPFKQKGTGNARQGSSRSPLMPGGGKVFGPVPRSYEYALPKKVRVLALKMALRSALDEGQLFIYDEISSDGKTRLFSKKLLEMGFKKALVLDGQKESLVSRSARNLKSFKHLHSLGLNVEDILRYKTVLLSKEALDALEARLGGGK
jgi:large subunit ribosomal protein L4